MTFFESIKFVFSSGGLLNAALAICAFAAFFLVFKIFFSLRANSKKTLLPPSDSAPDSARAAQILRSCKRDIALLKTLAFISPLLGLLGTVIGIAQCAASGGDARAISDGVSYSLITTQTGLVLAIPEWIAAIVFSARVKELQSRRESANIRQ